MKNKKVLIGAIAAVVVIVLAVLWATGVFNAPEKADDAVEEAVEAVEEGKTAPGRAAQLGRFEHGRIDRRPGKRDAFGCGKSRI